jgi:hypothetical protein
MPAKIQREFIQNLSKMSLKQLIAQKKVILELKQSTHPQDWQFIEMQLRLVDEVGKFLFPQYEDEALRAIHPHVARAFAIDAQRQKAKGAGHV